MTAIPSVPEHRNVKADSRSNESNAQRRGLESALAGPTREELGALAAIRRNCGLATLERWLASATSVEEVIEALLAATQDLVDVAPSYAAFRDDPDGTIRVLRHGLDGRRSCEFDAHHDLVAAASAQDPAYWGRVLRLGRQMLASPTEPGDEAWMAFPLTTPDGTYGALAVALPEGGHLPSDEEAALCAAVELGADTLHRLHLQRERDVLRLELEDARTQLERLRERVLLSEGMATIGELVSSVAHDLNNPLTSVIGFAQLLQSLDVDEGIRSDLAIIDSEARRCQRIVRNLLSLTHQRELDSVSVQVNDLVNRTLELKAYSLRMDNIETIVDLDPHLALVRANPCELQQALLNLMTNAQEAMSGARGGGTLLIRTEPATLDGRPAVRVSVVDDGPGVPLEVRPRLFEPFVSTKRQGGAGLGLAITRQIVEGCGGRLIFDEAHSPGAKFDLVLPAEAEMGSPGPDSWAKDEAAALDLRAAAPDRCAGPID